MSGKEKRTTHVDSYNSDNIRVDHLATEMPLCPVVGCDGADVMLSVVFLFPSPFGNVDRK